MNEEIRDIAAQLIELSQRLHAITVATAEKELGDADYVAFISAHPRWPKVSLSEIQAIVSSADPNKTCGKPRAIRLRDLAEQSL